MRTKSSPLALQAVSAEGTFEGWASVYGNVDSHGDIVDRGAFTDTIRENNGEIVILDQHDQHRPIGKGRLEDSAFGLKVYGELNLDTQAARDVHSNMRRGIIKGLSIGYQSLREQFDSVKKANRLLKLKLFEVSAVTFGSNPLAAVTNVKRASAHRRLTPEEEKAAIRMVDSLRGFSAEIEHLNIRSRGGMFWYREVSRLDINPDTERAATRALQQARKDLGVSPEIRWVRPELASLAQADQGMSGWKDGRAPVYKAEEDFSGRAYLLSGYMLLKHELGPSEAAKTVLHEAMHFSDAQKYGMPAKSDMKILDQWEARAFEYERRAFPALAI